MRNKKAWSFYSDIYRQNYCFLKEWSREQVEKTLEVELLKSAGITIEKGDVIFIWVENMEGEGISELVHECIYATNFTLGARGVKVSAGQDEAQAYLAQWIFQNCYKAIRRKTKK